MKAWKTGNVGAVRFLYEWCRDVKGREGRRRVEEFESDWMMRLCVPPVLNEERVKEVKKAKKA